MGGRHLPVGHLAGLIGEEREVERLGNGGQQIREVERGGGGVDGIPPEDQERLDRAGLHGGAEVGERRGGLGTGLTDGNRGAEIAEGGVDPDHKAAEGAGLLDSNKHKALPLRGDEVIGHSLDPSRIKRSSADGIGVGKRLQIGVAGLRGNGLRHGHGEVPILGSTHPDAVVGHAAGERESVLRNIETVHRRLRITTLRKAVRVAESILGGVQEIAADREDDIGLGEITRGARTRSEHGVEGRLGLARRDRLVLHPKHLGELGGERGAQALDGRGVLLADEDREAVAAVGSRGGADLGEEVVEIAATYGQGIVLDLLGAVRIVEVEDGSLRKDIGRAVAERVERIPLDLGRAAIGGGDNDRHGTRRSRHGAGVVEELARDGPLGALGEGNEVRLGTAASGETHAGDRGGGPHEADEIAAGEAIGSFTAGGLIGELAGEILVERRGILTLPLAPPEGRLRVTRGMLENLFHRWQPPQLTGGLTFHSSLNLVPSSRCAAAEEGCQFMLKISEGGRRKFSGARWQSRHHFILSDSAS